MTQISLKRTQSTACLVCTMSKLDDLDNFFLEGDLDNDPFASPKDSNKRKSPGDVNVDEEVSVAKKARVPRIKLDQERYACSSLYCPQTPGTHANSCPACFHKRAYPDFGNEQRT